MSSLTNGTNTGSCGASEPAKQFAVTVNESLSSDLKTNSKNLDTITSEAQAVVAQQTNHVTIVGSPTSCAGSPKFKSSKNVNESDDITTSIAATSNGLNVNDDKSWSTILDQVKSCVVALKVTYLRSFSGDHPAATRATGFVVADDLILTNHHVTGSGPIHATALFDQNEEVEVFPIYRDPVHDFAFLKFDRKQVRFTKIEGPNNLGYIPLEPEELETGADVRVVGNDNGEKLQILPGIIGRVDRNVPAYANTINQDENTFYVGSASNTSGGSSGSPVINSKGHAIALNAGGAVLSASAFYLPLWRVKRALELILKSKKDVTQSLTATSEVYQDSIIPRGTIEASFKYHYFDHCRRLGLPEDAEKYVISEIEKRQLGSGWPKTGMLVVDQVIPEGSADGGPSKGNKKCEKKSSTNTVSDSDHNINTNRLIPGDILFRINGQVVTDFVTYESILDDNVGKELKIEYFRGKKGKVNNDSVTDIADNLNSTAAAIKNSVESKLESTVTSTTSQKSSSSDNAFNSFSTSITVKSFQDFTPDRFVEFGGGVFHEIPYNYARMFNLPISRGVWTASRGFVLGNKICSYSIIYKINENEVNNLVDFVKAVRKIRHGERFSVTWQKQVSGESRRQKTSGIWMERKIIPSDITTWILDPKNSAKEADHWRKLSESESNEIYGVKDEEMMVEDIKEVKGLSNLKSFWTAQKTQIPTFARKIAPYLVVTEFRTPVGAEILQHNPVTSREGCGLIVDGLDNNSDSDSGSDGVITIVVDRESCPQLLGLVQVEFGKILKVPGKVKFIHPFHNIALITVEKSRLGDFPLPKKPLPWSRKQHSPGEDIKFVGLSDKKDLVYQDVSIISYFSPNYKLTNPPMWRERNVIGLNMVEELFSVTGGIMVTMNKKNSNNNSVNVSDDLNFKIIGIYLPFSFQPDERYLDVEYDYGCLPFYQYIAPLFPQRYVREEKLLGGLIRDSTSKSKSGTVAVNSSDDSDNDDSDNSESEESGSGDNDNDSEDDDDGVSMEASSVNPAESDQEMNDVEEVDMVDANEPIAKRQKVDKSSNGKKTNSDAKTKKKSMKSDKMKGVKNLKGIEVVNKTVVSAAAASDSTVISKPITDGDSKIPESTPPTTTSDNFNPSHFPSIISEIPTLSVEFKNISLSDAPHHGISTEWVAKLMEASTTNMQCLAIERLTQGGCGRKFGLEAGDVLLEINQRIIVSVLDVEEELRKWHYRKMGVEGGLVNGKLESELTGTVGKTQTQTNTVVDPLTLTIVRDNKEMKINNVIPTLIKSDTVTKMVIWNGMLLIPTPKAIRERGSKMDGSTSTISDSKDNDTENVTVINDDDVNVNDKKLDVTTTPNSANSKSSEFTVGSIYCASIARGSPASSAEMGQTGFSLEKIDDHTLPDDFDEFIEKILKSEYYSTKKYLGEEGEGEGDEEVDRNVAIGSPGSCEPDHSVRNSKKETVTGTVPTLTSSTRRSRSRSPGKRNSNNDVTDNSIPNGTHESDAKQYSSNIDGKDSDHGVTPGPPVNKSESETAAASFNSRFTRIMIKDLEGRQFAKTLLRNDKFFPALSLRRTEDGNFVREGL